MSIVPPSMEVDISDSQGDTRNLSQPVTNKRSHATADLDNENNPIDNVTPITKADLKSFGKDLLTELAADFNSRIIENTRNIQENKLAVTELTANVKDSNFRRQKGSNIKLT